MKHTTLPSWYAYYRLVMAAQTKPFIQQVTTPPPVIVSETKIKSPSTTTTADEDYEWLAEKAKQIKLTKKMIQPIGPPSTTQPGPVLPVTPPETTISSFEITILRQEIIKMKEEITTLESGAKSQERLLHYYQNTIMPEYTQMKEEIQLLRSSVKKHSDDLDKQNREVETKLKCTICFENDREIIFIPCNHLLHCAFCDKNFHKNNKNCPICRTPIQQISRIYFG